MANFCLLGIIKGESRMCKIFVIAHLADSKITLSEPKLWIKGLTLPVLKRDMHIQLMQQSQFIGIHSKKLMTEEVNKEGKIKPHIKANESNPLDANTMY